MIESKLVEEILADIERTDDSAAGKMLQSALVNRLLSERSAFHRAACKAECALRAADKHCDAGCSYERAQGRVCPEVEERVAAVVDPAAERELKGFHAIVNAERPRRQAARKRSGQ